MTFNLTHLYPGKRRKLERSTSYHQQDHKTRGGWFSKHHRRLCLGIVFLSIIATLTLIIINHTTTPDKSLGYENSTPLIQSFCRRYNSFCFEDKKTPLSSSSLEHDALGYVTSRIVYDYDIPTSAWASLPVRGALYMTVKNEDLQKVRETMRSLNDRLNHRLNYPWILLCNEGFTEDFIKYTSSLVPGPVYYGKIDPEALVYPSWINLDKVKASDQDLPTLQMMRYQSGLFYHHSLFSQVQYVWRIDPGMTFSCTMDDPFATMVANNKTYGVAATRRYQEQKSTEKIWKVTKNYMDYARSIHQEPLAAKDTIMQAVVDQHGYTSCHFWSLFEILSVEFLKSAPQQRFFEYMDHNGAFFYEKLTDSVYRTMAVAMYLKTDQIYFFNEIGFKKEGFISHCPLHANHLQKCACDIQGNDPNTVSVSVATLTIYNIEYGTPPFTHLSRVIGQSAQSNLIVLVCVVLDRLSFGTNNVWTRVLVFPCAWTSLWYINGYWGGHSGYSNGISDWAEWAQMVDLGGRAFLEFIMVLFATCLLEHQSWMALFLVKSSRRTPSNVNRSTNAMRLLKHPLSVYFGLVVFVYVYGGIQSSFRRGAFFQKPTKDWLPATETVACVVGPGGFDEDLRSDYSYWMQKSEDAAQRGAKLVLWSEEIILASTWEDEQRLRQMAITVAKKHSIYLVIAYDRLYPVNHNMAVMVSPQGHILIDYIKANPVPKDENNEPGPGALLFIDTPEFGRIGLAICYDLSVPRFILQASQHNVDILLQPAYSWGANGPNNLHDQQLRAIENGLTLFRCISQGISGIIEPVIHGHFEQKTAVIANQVVFFNLPLQKRIKTVYSAYLGDSIPYACILYSLNFVASLLYHHMKRIVK